MPRTQITQQLIEAGAVAVIRMKETDRLLHVAEALLTGGVSVMEVTMTTLGALGAIEALTRTFSEQMLLGVGSVLDAETTRRAIEAGARYVVSLGIQNPKSKIQNRMPRTQITQQLIEAGAVAVIRMKETDRLLHVAEALLTGGVSVMEVTMTTLGALGAIEALTRTFSEQMLLGVGSVLDAETTRRAIEAGARYVVSPVLKAEIIEAAHQRGVPALPGAFSPTEVQHAHELGADIIKVFPAGVLGMGYFKALLAPLPHLKLMPTGGVTLDNAGEWLRAGACAVGIGSALLDKKAIAEGNYAVLTENARTLRRSIEEGRG